MKIDILTPEKKLYSSDVYGVQLPGLAGSFEILEKHSPLISALKAGTVKVLVDKTQTIKFKITGGFAEVLNNRITVLAEAALDE
jgi:F-type H+-transporting ATPase subunit epsilon